MTWIRVHCDRCGTVELASDAVVIVDDHAYRFDCPLCERTHERVAARQTMAILVALECDTISTVITESDITEFVIALDSATVDDFRP